MLHLLKSKATNLIRIKYYEGDKGGVGWIGRAWWVAMMTDESVKA